MLYLAEVKKQNKGLIGGVKTELKLLAFQRNDQSWSAVTQGETISCESVNQVGEGALLMVNLSPNRQIQGTPEPAGAKIVSLLQKFSRLSEKSKDQDQEIEQWKQSLTYQSQELARREHELESRLEQLERMEEEFGPLQKQRQDIEEARRQLNEQYKRSEQELAEQIVFDAEQSRNMQELVSRLSRVDIDSNLVQEQLQLALAAVDHQQSFLDDSRQQLERQRTEIAQRQTELEQQAQALSDHVAALCSTADSLAQSQHHLHEQQLWYSSQQELAERLDRYRWKLEEIEELVACLAVESGAVLSAHPVDTDALEKMPLAELQGKVEELRQDLEKLIGFVKDQEEEVTYQFQAIQELQEKLNNAHDDERSQIAAELKDEKERKRMLDETLLGQRRNLRERQEFFLQHQRILHRRQGVVEESPVDFQPVLRHIETQRHLLQEDQQSLAANVEQISASLAHLQEQVQQQSQQHQDQEHERQHLEEAWQQGQTETARLQSRIEVFESLDPLQNDLNKLRQKLEDIQQNLAPVQHNERQQIAEQILSQLTVTS
ncbi:MAG: pilus motility taxis protein HmpF [Cyanophyceae cyanobacterium]